MTRSAEPTVARRESLIASDITIEGKIEGGGSVRIAGKFKVVVNVHGDLTID
jgi:cytoskeletal protein CcmA (bactofilin family)